MISKLIEMKEYSKEQLVKEFGMPIWGNPICNLEYLSGIDVFDTAKKSEGTKYPAFLYKYPNGLSIEIMLGIRKFTTGIDTDKIKNFVMTDYPDNILTICADYEGKEINISFSVKNEDFKDVEKSLKSNYPDLFKNFND